MKFRIFIVFISLLGYIRMQAQTFVPETLLVDRDTFFMGTRKSLKWERPVRKIILSPYHISKNEITVQQYRAFCSDTKRDTTILKGQDSLYFPVVNVTFNDAVAYCNWLTEKTGRQWRLPTEAEWEYAAGRNASLGKVLYQDSIPLRKRAWFSDNSGGVIHEGKQKLRNELGLYDMLGNVWEWCLDWNGKYPRRKKYYSKENPSGKDSGSKRIVRGGSYLSPAKDCTPTYRNNFSPSTRKPDIGFRVVKEYL